MKKRMSARAAKALLLLLTLSLCLAVGPCTSLAAKKTAPAFEWSVYTVKVMSVFDKAAVTKKFKKNKELLARMGSSSGVSRAVKVRLKPEGESFTSFTVTILKNRPYYFALLDEEGTEYPPVSYEIYNAFGIEIMPGFSTQRKIALVFDVPEEIALDDLSLHVREEKEAEGVTVSLKDAPRLDDDMKDDYTNSYAVVPFVK